MKFWARPPGEPRQTRSGFFITDLRRREEFRQCLNGTMLGSYQYPNCE